MQKRAGWRQERHFNLCGRCDLADFELNNRNTTLQRAPRSKYGGFMALNINYTVVFGVIASINAYTGAYTPQLGDF